MANNYNQATVSPELPASLFTEHELLSLISACGLSAWRDGETLYFFAEASFCEIGDDDQGKTLDCTAVFQEKLRQLDPAAYSHILIQGATTCSKMRADEFGGYAILITRDDIRSMSTWQWLEEQRRGACLAPATTRPYSVLLLYPDYATDLTPNDTYYAFVEAPDAIAAVEAAQREAVAAQGVEIDNPTDFHPLLVTQGHHRGEALWNK